MRKLDKTHSSTRGKKRAIVGVARRLIGRIRLCVSTGVFYEIKSTEEACLSRRAA